MSRPVGKIPGIPIFLIELTVASCSTLPEKGGRSPLLAWTIILLTGLRSWWSQTNVPLQLFPASIDEGSSSQTGRMAASPAEAPRQLDDGARPAGMSDRSLRIPSLKRIGPGQAAVRSQ